MRDNKQGKPKAYPQTQKAKEEKLKSGCNRERDKCLASEANCKNKRKGKAVTAGRH